MTGAEILSLLKEGGYGIAVLSIVANVFLVKHIIALYAARLADKDKCHEQVTAIAVKSIEADKDNQHAIALFAKALESRPHA